MAKSDEPKTTDRRFGVALSRNTDPDTSAAAAASVRGSKANALESKVLDTLQAHSDGLTSSEVANLLDLHAWSISPRFAPLRRKGLIFDSGERSGRSIVWKPTVSVSP